MSRASTGFEAFPYFQSAVARFDSGKPREDKQKHGAICDVGSHEVFNSNANKVKNCVFSALSCCVSHPRGAAPPFCGERNLLRRGGGGGAPAHFA